MHSKALDSDNLNYSHGQLLPKIVLLLLVKMIREITAGFATTGYKILHHSHEGRQEF